MHNIQQPHKFLVISNLTVLSLLKNLVYTNASQKEIPLVIILQLSHDI